jgi:peptide/nickel transport system permease protein
MKIDDQINAPPFRPSPPFPWGSDQIGRDVQALVLWGARQTLTLALFGMLARLLVGTMLGLIAGWQSGSRLDRLITGAIDVWAAFPAVLLAMLVIQALGIQQGMGVFVAALAFVGWGEVAQFVREQVRTIQPQLYIEAARSTGASPVRILQHEVLPNLLPALVVLGALEMGAVLLLLAELGFLNIFLGGGFKVEFQIDKITYFSDIPEWGALLANIRDWWRSYPWMAWYPSLAFFLSIMAFNLLGEGLRRFLEETPYNLTRLFNRYTLLILATLVAGLGWSLRATAPISVYQSQAEQFNTERALQDVRALAGPELQGRESGTGGATAAALYIARQMELAGLFPAGEKDSYLQRLSCQLPHLADVPGLEVNDGAGDQWRRLVYRQDFVEVVRAGAPAYSDIQGRLVGIAFGPHPGTTATDPYSMRQLELKDKVILAVGIQDLLSYRLQAAGGVLIVQDDVSYFERKYLFPEDTLRGRYIPTPVMAITPQVAEALLQGSGTSLETLRARAATLSAGQFEMTQPGQLVKMHLKAILHDDPPDTCINVIGFIPGVGAEVEYQGRKLNNNAIVVSAYYDGLGVGPEGTLYPGANDNASGVAAMLEMARLLKNSPYQPKKTVIFAAWSGGERGSGVSLFNLMNARTGFNNLTIEAVLELSGAGGGTNAEIDLAPGSSYRLVQLYQQATAQLGYKITTRGRNPHFGLSIAPGFGGRTGLTAYLSCNGSDQIAHKARDGYEAIQPKRFEMLGRTSLLGVLILSREVNY